MCSQRTSMAVLLFQARSRLLAIRRFPIVQSSRRNFDISGQVDRLWLVVAVDLLPHDLVSTVFPGHFDLEDVLPRLYRFALIVIAVPLQCILTGRARGAGD